MYTNHGGEVIDIQGLECNLPKPGFVFNRITKQLEYRGIAKRHESPDEQFFVRETEPLWYRLKRKAEETIQIKEAKENEGIHTHVDPECEAYRQEQWDKRLNGTWFYNNGKPCYLTGMYWMYLTHWQIDIGYPKFRIPDLEYFYFLQYCIEDPICMGMTEVTKRRFGKTFRCGLFLYEYTSRTKEANSGLQSKTDADAKKVFSKAIIKPFKKLPHFFRPVFDRSQGITPKSELRFEQTNVRGAKAEITLHQDELGSVIDFQASDPMSYDGSKLHRYVGDEVGKTKKIDVSERWDVVRYCLLDDEGRIIGKALLTTTVEEMEKGGEKFQIIWNGSDHIWIQNPDGTRRKRKRDEPTESGLYRFFMPAYRTRNFDKFGYPDEKLTREQILRDRATVANNPKALSARIRKEPFTIEEAFRVDGKDCMFNDVNLNNRLGEIMPDEIEFVNLEWKDGKRDNPKGVNIKPALNGRWVKIATWKPKDGEDINLCEQRGERLFPTQNWRYAQGCDPYDHEVTEDGRRSMAAALLKLKAYPRDMSFQYINGYVLMYLARPASTDIFYEDMVMQCVLTGAQMLVENNKQGLIKYFRWRGYGQFLMHLKGYKEVGIPSTPDNKKQGAEMVEFLIEYNINAIGFAPLLKDWLKFNILETKKYDLSMASLWTEWAAQFKFEPPVESQPEGEEAVDDSLFDSFAC